jgi:hypothetical protein
MTPRTVSNAAPLGAVCAHKGATAKAMAMAKGKAAGGNS